MTTKFCKRKYSSWMSISRAGDATETPSTAGSSPRGPAQKVTVRALSLLAEALTSICSLLFPGTAHACLLFPRSASQKDEDINHCSSPSSWRTSSTEPTILPTFTAGSAGLLKCTTVQIQTNFLGEIQHLSQPQLYFNSLRTEHLKKKKAVKTT